MNEMDARVSLTDLQRQMDWINEHGWKIETRPRRSLRMAIAKALLAMARRIAPVYPETEQRTDALARS